MTDPMTNAPEQACAHLPLLARVLALCVFGTSLLLYLLTMPPTLPYGGDCGDLISASYTLGICHPTGYPLYLLLGKLFSMLVPFGDIAYRYNLFSALCAAGTNAVLTLLIYHLGAGAGGSIFGAAMLAVSYIYWSQAIIAEVYTLNALLFALFLYCVQRWHSEDEARFLYLAAVMLGLGLANHLTMLLLIPVFLALIFRRPGRVSLRQFLLSAGCACFPLVVYLYLPLRAKANPHWFWTNPDTLMNFLHYVSGRLYRGHMFGLPLRELPSRLTGLISLLGIQFLAGNLFTLGGLIVSARSRSPFGLCTIATAALMLIFYLPYDVPDVWLFFIPFFFLWALWMGIGASALETKLSAIGVPKQKLSLRALLCLTVLVQAWAAYPRANMRGHRYARLDAEEVIQSTGEEGTLLTGADELLFAIWYLQQVEHRAQALRTVPMAYPEERWKDGSFQQAARRAFSLGRVYTSTWMPVLQSAFTCVLKPRVVELRPLKLPDALHPQEADRIPRKFSFADTACFPTTKRGSLRLATLCWSTEHPESKQKCLLWSRAVQYRFRLYASASGDYAPSKTFLPTEGYLRKLEQESPRKWTTEWTTTYLLPAREFSSPNGSVAVPVWIPENVLAISYHLWGRIESLPAGARYDSPAVERSEWQRMGTIHVIDK